MRNKNDGRMMLSVGGETGPKQEAGRKSSELFSSSSADQIKFVQSRRVQVHLAWQLTFGSLAAVTTGVKSATVAREERRSSSEGSVSPESVSEPQQAVTQRVGLPLLLPELRTLKYDIMQNQVGFVYT